MTARTHADPHRRSNHPQTSMRQLSHRRQRRRVREIWRSVVRFWRGT